MHLQLRPRLSGSRLGFPLKQLLAQLLIPFFWTQATLQEGPDRLGGLDRASTHLNRRRRRC